MYEKKIIYFSSLILAVISLLLTGCATTSKARRDEGAFLSHQREIDGLTQRINFYQDTLDTASRELGEDIKQLDSIRARANGIEGTAAEIIVLFSEYTDAVEQFIRHYYNLRTKIETANNRTDDTISSPAN